MGVDSKSLATKAQFLNYLLFSNIKISVQSKNDLNNSKYFIKNFLKYLSKKNTINYLKKYTINLI
jgi:hypothetical protein